MSAGSDRLRHALEAVRQARQVQPPAGQERFREGLLLVIAARNDLLRPRPSAPAPASADPRRLNALLSLMSSVEFPVGGYHAERLGAIERELEALAAPD